MKTTHNGKEYTLNENEDGSITLTPIEKVETRHPMPGGVWRTVFGSIYIVGADSSMKLNGTLAFHGNTDGAETFYDEGDTYLGTFDEVYVKKQDVIDALSHKDDNGDDMIEWMDIISEAQTIASAQHNLTKP